MSGFLILGGAVAIVSVIAALSGHSDDRTRLAEARRTLRRSGRHFAKGSREERRALMIVLEGGSLDQI